MKFVFLFLLTFNAFAHECLPPITRSDFAQIVNHTKETYFPDLHHLNISIKEFKSDAYFLQAQPDLKTVMKKASLRRYFVEVNPKIFACPPTHDALEAILIHEFEHIRDYNVRSSVEIGILGAKYGLSKKYRTKYERQTDEKALYQGFGPGLIQYRLWIYAQLTPEQIRVKKRYYFTPEEIEIWMRDHVH